MAGRYVGLGIGRRCSLATLSQARFAIYKGRPVPSTYLIFQPEDATKRPSHGLTDDDGRFTLTNRKSLTGVYLGSNTVSLRYYQRADEEMGKTPPKAPMELKAVSARYA